MVLKCIEVMKNIHKLKIMIKGHRLAKYDFIRVLQTKGLAKIPEDLKISRYPLSYQFYDPVPKLIEVYANLKLRRLQPLKNGKKGNLRKSI
jgi:hypothetical protein